jgi:pimeloyl-ACP methyl ester carboxylesterase
VRISEIQGFDATMLSYREREGDHIPVIMLHGSGFSQEVFDQQFDSDQLVGNSLIAVDLPGHGASPDAVDAQATYSYAGFAAAIADFITWLGIEHCIVAGWSLGGQVALEMIDSMPQVAGVMAFGAPPAPAGPLRILRSMHYSVDLLLAAKARMTHADATRFEKAAIGAHAKGQFVDTILRTDEKMRPHLSKSIMKSEGRSQKQRVENAHIPVCLLHCDQDHFVRTNYMRSVTGPTLFGGKTIIFKGTGHAPFIEEQARFDLLLSNFVDAVEAGLAATEENTHKNLLQAG